MQVGKAQSTPEFSPCFPPFQWNSPPRVSYLPLPRPHSRYQTGISYSRIRSRLQGKQAPHHYLTSNTDVVGYRTVGYPLSGQIVRPQWSPLQLRNLDAHGTSINDKNANNHQNVHER